jgi:hypothetical protein
MKDGDGTDHRLLSNTISESAWSRRVFQSTTAAFPDTKVNKLRPGDLLNLQFRSFTQQTQQPFLRSRNKTESNACDQKLPHAVEIIAMLPSAALNKT